MSETHISTETVRMYCEREEIKRLRADNEALKEAASRVSEYNGRLEYHINEALPQIGELRAENEALRAQIAEARADERQAMAYLSEVRAIVGGDDFPDMIKRAKALHVDAETFRMAKEHVKEAGYGGSVSERTWEMVNPVWLGDRLIEIEALRAKLPRWIPFNHNDTGIWGLLWVRMEGPEFDIDVDSYGAAIGVPTGRTITKTLLGFVEWDGDCLPNGRTDYYPVVRAVDPTERDPDENWTITHYASVLPPAAPEQEPPT